MILYKWVSKNFETKNGMKWEEGVPNHAVGNGGLCTDGVLHAYRSKFHAEFFGRIHTRAVSSILIEVDSSEIVDSDFTKVGSKTQTMIRVVESIHITSEQRVEIAIRFSMTEYCTADYTRWAEDWLSGKDRSATTATAATFASGAARTAAYAAAAYAYAADADAARTAAAYAARTAAAYAARTAAAYAARTAAAYAAYAADAAYAARTAAAYAADAADADAARTAAAYAADAARTAYAYATRTADAYAARTAAAYAADAARTAAAYAAYAADAADAARTAAADAADAARTAAVADSFKEIVKQVTGEEI